MVVVNRKVRAIWAANYFINKPFHAFNRQRKAPTVLQIYEHAQIINAYIHKGESRDSGEGVLSITGHQFYIAPYGN